MAGQASCHYDLLVVGTVGAGLHGTVHLMNRASLGRSSHHKRRWKSLRLLEDLLVGHLAWCFAIKRLNQVEKVPLELVWIGFFISLAILFHTISLQFVLLSHHIDM